MTHDTTFAMETKSTRSVVETFIIPRPPSAVTTKLPLEVTMVAMPGAASTKHITSDRSSVSAERCTSSVAYLVMIPRGTFAVLSTWYPKSVAAIVHAV